MTIKEFAEKLNGKECGLEMSLYEEKQARELGFVVVFGYSDDTTIFKGAIDDDEGSFDGADILIDKDGVFRECDCGGCKYSEIAKEKTKLITVLWGEGEYSWQYETDIPHETFDILEGGEKYCKGIVFDIRSLEENNE